MFRPSVLFERLKAAFRPDSLHQEVSEELQFHIDMKSADLMQTGLSAEDARREATRRFGRAMRTHEEAFDARAGVILEQVGSDVRFALRLLRKDWKRTTVLLATFALGLGANTGIFGVLFAVLLQPLPFAQPEQLVVLQQAEHGKPSGVSYPNFLDWRDGSRLFSNMAVYTATESTLTGRGEPVMLQGAIASASLFQVLQVPPLRGRLFRASEDRFSTTRAAAPVLISETLWRSRFGGRDDVLGSLIRLDSKTFEVIGIIPSRFAFPIRSEPIQFWTSVAVDADPAFYGGTVPFSRGYPRYDGALARCRPNVTIQAARHEMSLIAARIAHDHPHSTAANDVNVQSALAEVVGPANRTMLFILYAAVCCVLLVAFVNVGNILALQSLTRSREISVRLALGAQRGRLIRQSLVESFILAGGGAVAGSALAWMALRAMVAFAPAETPRLSEIQFTPALAGYIILLSGAAALLLGLLSSLGARAGAGTAAWKGSSRGGTRRNGVRSPASAVIAVQIMAAMALTGSAVLLVQSFQQLLHSQRGFNSHGVLTASIALPVSQYGQGSPRVVAFYQALMNSLSATPGVDSAALAESLPLTGQSNGTSVGVVGEPVPGLPDARLRFVDPGYFSLLRIPLLRGRIFQSTDTPLASPCVIVNQAFVRKFLHGRDPLSAQLQLGWGGAAPKQIIGLVPDIRYLPTSAESLPEVYVPVSQFPLNSLSLLVRSSSEHSGGAALAETIRNAVRQIDRSVPLDHVQTLDDYLLLSAAQNRFLMSLLVAFAAITVTLAAIGIYGSLSSSVQSRLQEVGVRLALGCSRTRIAVLVMRQVMVIGVVGVTMGAALAVLATRYLSRWLYDPHIQVMSSVAAGGMVILAAAVIASWPSVARATRVDAAQLLRSE